MTNEELVTALRKHDHALWKANSRGQAVDWMAYASELMLKAADAIEYRRNADLEAFNKWASRQPGMLNGRYEVSHEIGTTAMAWHAWKASGDFGANK